ncbi:hypothetical protein AVEN_173561-1 [Araneus ventricosus]|uniref:Uncharacterized protein n=1 Tax=Araneus ventricosus TaxID=182803 RepID=A0A4Y2U0P9_ARAVE|nr:hypothetical protein AVEN_173561-1 [Araneus ventricosus]
MASLYGCKLSVRDSVYVIDAVVEALGHNTEECIINKSSIYRIRQIKRKESAESIKVAFQNDIPQILTVHWYGKLLPALNVRDAKEERLPIIVSFGERTAHWCSKITKCNWERASTCCVDCFNTLVSGN